MAFELRELSGNIFPNNNKKADNHPDFRGEFLLNGEPYEIALWNKEGARGPFKGFKISPKRQRTEQPVPHGADSISQQALSKVRKPDPITSGRSLRDDMDDSIPF